MSKRVFAKKKGTKVLYYLSHRVAKKSKLSNDQ